MEVKNFNATLEKLTLLKDSVELYENTIQSIHYIKDLLHKRSVITIKFPSQEYYQQKNLSFSMPSAKVLEILEATLEEQKQYLKSNGINCD